MTAFRSTGCDETPGSGGGGCGSGSAGLRSEISFRFELDEDGNEPEACATLVGDPCGGGDGSTGTASASASSRPTVPIAARRQLPIPRVELGPDEYNDTSVTVMMMSDSVAKDSEAQCDQSPRLDQLPPSVRTSTTALTSGGGASVKVEITDRRLVSATGGRRLGARHAMRSTTNAVATAVADGSGGGGESLQVPTMRRTGGGLNNNQRQSLLGRPVGATPRRPTGNRRRDARYRRCQARLYNFLERPKNWRSILYHLLV
jgi:hypothetical protein